MAVLSHTMHRLNTAYAQRFNRRHGRRGHLFESRFSAWVIRDDEHLEGYVPVRARQRHSGRAREDGAVAVGGARPLREQGTNLIVRDLGEVLVREADGVERVRLGADR